MYKYNKEYKIQIQYTYNIQMYVYCIYIYRCSVLLNVFDKISSEIPLHLLIDATCNIIALTVYSENKILEFSD